MKNQEYIQIEPQVIEVPFPDDKPNSLTVMKIKNLSDNTIRDLRFSIYNTEKFVFTPEVFHLQGHEEIIIKVQLKPQSSKKSFKSLAYLKAPSPLINKRITLLVGRNNQNNSFISNNSRSQASPNPVMQDLEPSEEIEIQRKKHVLQEHDITDPQSLSNRAYNIALAKAHEKVLMQKDALIDKIQMEMQSKVAQCLKYQDEIKTVYREAEIDKMRLNEYRAENEQLISKLSQNETQFFKFKQQRAYSDTKKVDNQKTILILKREIEEQKRMYELDLNRYEVRLSELQFAMKEEESMKSIERIRIQEQLRIREEEVRRVRFDTARQYELENSRLGEQKQKLIIKVENYMNEIQYYKEEMIRSRLDIERRLGERHALTLEQLKSQNEVLNRKKFQLQSALQGKENELQMYKNRMKDTSPIKQSYREQNAQQLINLKQQNVMLLERLNNMLNQTCHECQDKMIQIEQLNIKIKQKDLLFEKERDMIKFQQQQNTKTLQRQLDNLNKTAMTQIKKLKEEKKKLQKELKTEEDEKSKTLQATKLESLENQLAEMRQELLHVKTKQKDQRKVGIKNQSKEIEQSRTSKSHSLMKDERVYEQLGQLREVEKILKIEQKRLEDQNGIISRQGIFGIVDMFRMIRQKLNTEKQWWRQQESEYLNEIRGLKMKLVGVENNKEKENFNANSTYLSESNKKLYQYIQEEMKNQYKKLNDTIQLLQDKYEIFKRKILSEFKSRIMQVVLKKDKKEISKLESLLQKMVESVYNTSHKEALYSRQVKRKLQLRKQNKDLRGKVTQLQLIAQEKKGQCSRDPVRVIVRKQEDLFKTVKLQATLMSCRAQNQRLKEEVDILKQTLSATTQEHKITIEILEKREDDVSKLKEEIVEIDNMHRQQLTNAVTELQLMKGQFLKISQLEQRVLTLSGKQKQNQELKDQLQRKKELIKALKEKERTLNDVIENTHRQIQNQQHSVDKVKRKQQYRLQEMIGEFKDKNRQLKAQLEKREDIIKQLKQDLEKKNAYIATQKMASNNSTTRGEKEKIQSYLNQIQLLKEENRKLCDKNSQVKNQNTKLHNQIDNLKSKINEVEKQVTRLHNDLKNQQNEYLIKEKSLQSNIRGTVQMLRQLWRYIEFKVRKISSQVKIKDTFDELVKDHNNLDVRKLLKGYEGMLEMIE